MTDDIENINRRVYGEVILFSRRPFNRDTERNNLETSGIYQYKQSKEAQIGIQWKIRELAKKYNVGKVPRMSNINYTMRMMVTEGILSSDEYQSIVKYTTSKESEPVVGFFR